MIAINPRAIGSIHRLLDHWSALPSIRKTSQADLLSEIRQHLGEFRFWPMHLWQDGDRLLLEVIVPKGDDADEYCAALQDLFDYPRLAVEPARRKAVQC